MVTRSVQIAQFAHRTRPTSFGECTTTRLKHSILDTLGVSVGALDAAPMRAVKVHIQDFNPHGTSSMIGGGRTSPDMAAFYNSGLTNFLDYNDGYISRHDSTHPSSILAALVATLEYCGGSGQDLLCAMAVSYEVQSRLCDMISMRHKGLDHTPLTSISTAAGVGYLLEMDEDRMANAICMAASNASLDVARTGALSEWVGFADPSAVQTGLTAAYLARRGINGPSLVFEGRNGLDSFLCEEGSSPKRWTPEEFDSIERISLRKYLAAALAQSAIESAIQLRILKDLDPQQIARVELTTFQQAYDELGGGNGDDRHDATNRVEASRSLPYLVAVALIDGKLTPDQFRQRRIRTQDVQDLSSQVQVKTHDDLTKKFPDEMGCNLKVVLKNGTEYSIEKRDYKGFYSRPMTWDDVESKFHTNTRPFANEQLRQETIDVVKNLEHLPISRLTSLYGKFEAQ